jgi:hypothetical protein
MGFVRGRGTFDYCATMDGVEVMLLFTVASIILTIFDLVTIFQHDWVTR